MPHVDVESKPTFHLRCGNPQAENNNNGISD